MGKLKKLCEKIGKSEKIRLSMINGCGEAIQSKMTNIC